MVAIVTDVHYRMSLALIRDLGQAGVDVINLRREGKGTPGRVKTLRGTTAWINEAGLGIKDLMDRY